MLVRKHFNATSVCLWVRELTTAIDILLKHPEMLWSREEAELVCLCNWPSQRPVRSRYTRAILYLDCLNRRKTVSSQNLNSVMSYMRWEIWGARVSIQLHLPIWTTSKSHSSSYLPPYSCLYLASGEPTRSWFGAGLCSDQVADWSGQISTAPIAHCNAISLSVARTDYGMHALPY